MKRATVLTTFILSIGAASPVMAQSVLIDFETPTSFASIDTHYAGGTDSAGVAGANLGVAFGGDALAVQNDALGPYFSNAPSLLGVMAPVGPDAFMNVAVGFTDLSFFYSSNTAVADAVKVWSGLNGTGTMLASLSLANNAQSGCNDSPFCRFDALSTTWAGVALSVGFGDAAGVAGFDNVAITAVPEPTTSLLMALGLASLAGLGLARRR
jgi:hypothetical protein